jgi:hypothetical protein
MSKSLAGFAEFVNMRLRLLVYEKEICETVISS